MDKFLYKISEEFTKYPGGRYRADGPFSGEEFRESVLVPAIKSHDLVEINLDGTLGYGSSFLEESFGGLIRSAGFTTQQVRKHLVVQSKLSDLISTVWECIELARPKGMD